MLRYEASKDLTNAILNNWLLKLKDELGKCIPGDLHQEHYNKWLEDMIQKHGGEFDNQFFRQTISPNVHHFLHIKEEVETAFNLQHRGKTHTSPHLSSELRLLLTTFKEEEVHLFRSGRSLGHAAVNQFARGWWRLEDDKLSDFLTKSTVLGDVLQEIRRLEEGDDEMRSDSPTTSIPGSDSSDSSDSKSSVRTSSSSSSTGSMRSLADIEPNEPDDDGDDLSNTKLSSGSGIAMTMDQETGMLVVGHEDVEEEESSEEEQEEEPEAESGEEASGEDE